MFSSRPLYSQIYPPSNTNTTKKEAEPTLIEISLNGISVFENCTQLVKFPNMEISGNLLDWGMDFGKQVMELAELAYFDKNFYEAQEFIEVILLKGCNESVCERFGSIMDSIFNKRRASFTSKNLFLHAYLKINSPRYHTNEAQRMVSKISKKLPKSMTKRPDDTDKKPYKTLAKNTQSKGLF